MVARVPHEILVTGWFPSIDDPFAGRFIADQVAALLADGRARPTVAAFENIPVFGPAAMRGRQGAAIGTIIGSAGPPGMTTPGAFGPAGIPVARLAIPAGRTPDAAATHEADRRLEALARLVDQPGSHRPALVHGHVGYPDGTAGADLAARLGIPFVLTEHATFLDRLLADPVSGRAYRSTAARAARIIAVSRVLARQLEAALPDLGERLVVIPNTVAVDEFAVTEPSERRPGELLWVGYRRPIKGIDTLLRAFRSVRDHRPEATLRLIGRSSTDEEESTWVQLAAELGIGSAVGFEPPADRAGVAAAMARAAVFVHPSRWETFGVVAVEALASGLPVVACDSGGVTEVLGDDPESLGALVPKDDPEALAKGILRTLDRLDSFDPDALRSHVEDRYGSAAVAARIADLYEEVLEGPPGHPMPRDRPDRTAIAPIGGPVLGPSDRVVVSAFLRGQLDRLLARTPDRWLDRLDLVTSGPALEAHPGTRLAQAGAERRVARILVDPGRGPGGLRGVARRARRTIQRVGGTSEATVLTELRVVLSDAAGDTRPWFVGLSGLDHLVALPLVEAGLLRPLPGGIRWLADRHWRPADAPGTALIDGQEGA